MGLPHHHGLGVGGLAGGDGGDLGHHGRDGGESGHVDRFVGGVWEQTGAVMKGALGPNPATLYRVFTLTNCTFRPPPSFLAPYGHSP